MQRALGPGEYHLRWGSKPVGTYFTFPGPDFWDLSCEPFDDLRSDTLPFINLRKRLRDLDLEFTIHDSGRVVVRIPKGRKYGPVLGLVAYVYHVHMEADRSA